MAWNRNNWKTTVTGGISALSMILPSIIPGIGPICTAIGSLTTALFGFFAADKGPDTGTPN